jgi:type I restriction enzyme S subunit
MAERARLSPPRPELPTEWPWHTTRWASFPVSTLWGGERRLEADAYLASGYGERLAIESRETGWKTLGALARVWQPSRLKGIQVSKSYGTPFLAATQVFALRPSPRKFLSLDRTDDSTNRFVDSGTILVTCSGNVGRTTLAYRPLEETLISHDLLRVDALRPTNWGWLYSYLRSSRCRAMMTAAQYGHVIKHLEIAHLNALPVPDITDKDRNFFHRGVTQVLEMRNKAVDLIREAEKLLADAVGPVHDADDQAGFSVSSDVLFGKRRRLEAAFHHPHARAILNTFDRQGLAVETLDDVTDRVWWLTRFKRVFGEGGMPYLSSDDLFSVNPPIAKRVMIEQADAPDDYFVQAGWIMMACSGQTYGLNGSVALLDKRHETNFFSHDIVRIVPTRKKIRPGYLYAVLGHPDLGRPLVIRNAYGTSIPHLDPADVATIPIVRLDPSLEAKIADRMEEAVALRAESDALENNLGDRADQIIEAFIHDQGPGSSS